MTIQPKRFSSFIELIKQFKRLHQGLLDAMSAKIEAMKQGDFEQMRRLDEKQRELVKAVREREGIRRQLLDAIGRDEGKDSGQLRKLSLLQLASRLVEPQRLELLDAARELKLVMGAVARKNNVAKTVVGGVLENLRFVFESVKAGSSKESNYSGAGTAIASNAAGMLDAVG